MFKFLKKAFSDMKKSAKEQHEVDKANFAAAKAESRATWEEAKQSPSARAKMMSEQRAAEIADAEQRAAAAKARIAAAKARRGE